MKSVSVFGVMLFICTMAVGQEGPKPTKEHEFLKKNLGTRTGTMKIFVGGPDAKPLEMPFKETNTSIHNGFWVQSEFESGPYKGRGMNGFNPVTKKYIGTWTSNMTPHMSVMEGTYDESAHELTMTFRDYDEATGKLTDHRAVGQDAPGKPEVFTMYKKDAKSGKWVKSFILEYAAK